MEESYKDYKTRQSVTGVLSLYGSGVLTGYLLANDIGIYDQPMTWTTAGFLGLGGALRLYSILKSRPQRPLTKKVYEKIK